jgi:hypothetical protein
MRSTRSKYVIHPDWFGVAGVADWLWGLRGLRVAGCVCVMVCESERERGSGASLSGIQKPPCTDLNVDATRPFFPNRQGHVVVCKRLFPFSVAPSVSSEVLACLRWQLGSHAAWVQSSNSSASLICPQLRPAQHSPATSQANTPRVGYQEHKAP